MKVTFTGTRRGLTQIQGVQVAISLNLYDRSEDPVIMLHGACHGADREAHIYVLYHMMYPSNEEQYQWAVKHQTNKDSVYSTSDPLKRNRFMVDNCKLVVAAPGKMIEELRSGTWATIRYTRKLKKHLIICWPDGSTTVENGLQSV